MGAIIIIAIFYSGKLSQISLLVATVCIIVLYVFNRRGVADIPTYLFVGMILWLAVLKSGVHATLAGVVLAFFIPMSDPKQPNFSPAKYMEHSLHPIVAFFILPVFAFANAGVSLEAVSWSSLLDSVPLGIASGLFIGKQVGIFLFCGLVVAIGLVKLPEGLNLKSLYGASILCGIGFTMSLFIGGLAFQQSGGGDMMDDRIGILTGSILSGLVGYFFLHFTLPKKGYSARPIR